MEEYSGTKGKRDDFLHAATLPGPLCGKPVPLSPFAHGIQERHQGSAPFRQAVFHLWRNLRVFLPVHQPVGFQLLQGGAQGLIGDLPDVALHFVEPYHLELHKRIENRHFVFAVDQGEGIAESCVAEARLGDTPFIHCTLSSG